MKRRFVQVLAAVVCAAFSLAAQKTTEPVQSVPIKSWRAHPSQILARYKDGVSESRRSSVLAEFSVKEKERSTSRPGFVVLTLIEEVKRGGALSAEKQSIRLLKEIERLRASGLFRYVEPDYLQKANAAPTDVSFADGTLWSLRNTGQSDGINGADIDAVRAWDLSTGSTNVVVAIIDTGIRYTHDDLAGQMWRNPGEIPGNGVDDDQDGYVDNVFGINAITGSGDPFDDHDHGTHCAGTIGAAANDGHPHVGVAWQVRLMACKFLDSQGYGFDSDAIRCVDFSVSKGARILSNSWGGGGFSQALFDAISDARDRGVLFVAAAGNDSANTDNSPSYPSNYELENVVSVAALDRQDHLADFSNYGQLTVDLGAPGVSIYSSTSSSDSAYSTFSGTSMATPHVAGVAALIAARFPEISLPDMRQRLLSTTVSIPSLSGRAVSGGRLNAYNALNASPDGILDVQVVSIGDLIEGRIATLLVRVSDLSGVTNASVVGSFSGLASLPFSNDGVPPDAVGLDATYSAAISVPNGLQELTVTVNVTAPGKLPAVVTRTFAIIHVPPNDMFADASILSGLSSDVTGSSMSATKEPGEPSHAGIAGGRSVWWKWTALSSGEVTVHTAGSDFDTVLAVYTGTTVDSLTPLVANDDSDGGLSSRVAFVAEQGITYQVTVDGYLGRSGSIHLILVQTGAPVAPPNDNFADRIALAGEFVTATANTLVASTEIGEPYHAGIPGGRSAWWSWTAPHTGMVQVQTYGSNVDTLLGVYKGTSLGGLSFVAGNDDGDSGTQSRLEFFAAAGSVFEIAVDGFYGAGGSAFLTIYQFEQIPPPPNDLFAARVPLTGLSPIATGNNAGASKEGWEPDHAQNSGGRSVWWSWTLPADGEVVVRTTGSGFDTLLAVYIGNSVNSLKLVSQNDQDPAGGDSSLVVFWGVAGTILQIAVDGNNQGFGAASGEIILSASVLTRRVWEIGTDSSLGTLPYNPYGEFSPENGREDAAPGRVTRLPSDPLYNPATNPGADDDFYFSGVYSPGFNGLTATLVVPNDEPPTAWERAHTQADRTNRVHLQLGSEHLVPGATFRLGMEFPSGGSSSGGLVQPGFGVHDMVVRFRNGLGVATVLYNQRITATTNLLLTFTSSAVGATAGANTLEIVRTGPLASGTASWILYDFLRFESFPPGNAPPAITQRPTGANVAPGQSVVLSVRADSAQTPSYQWYRNKKAIPGANSASYPIARAGVGDIGDYYVVVSNANGSVSSFPDNDVRVTLTGAFVIEAEDYNYGNGQTVGGASVMPLASGLYQGRDGVAGVDFFIIENNVDSGCCGNNLRNGWTNNGVVIPAASGANVAVNLDNADGNAWRPDFVLSNNYKVGWGDTGEWYNYTRTFPPGRYSAVFIGAREGRAPGAMGRTLELVTGNPAQPNQTTELLGDLLADGTGGWGSPDWIPFRVPGAGNVAEFELGGSQTLRVRHNVGDGDDDAILMYRVSSSVNRPPTLARPADQTLDEEQTLRLTLSATDLDLPAQTLSYSQVRVPAGMVVSVTGEVTWTPAEAQGPSTNLVEVRVTDSGVPPLSATNSFRVVVREVNRPPLLASIGNQSLGAGQLLRLVLVGSDTDLPPQTLTYSRVSGPAGLTVSNNGVVNWTPTVAQSPGEYPVTVQVADSGAPALGTTTTFSVTVTNSSGGVARRVWQIGTDNSLGTLPYNPSGEFSPENGREDAAPGRVTRLPSDPLYNPATNPGADDDFYFSGVYPPGFNGLTATLAVPNDEPPTAWERAHTQADRTNRVHLQLGSEHLVPGALFRLGMEFPSGGSSSGGLVQPGFGVHDMVVRFRNGPGVATVLYNQRIAATTNLLLTFTSSAVGATAGANTLEIVRTGPLASGTALWILYDFLRLESFPPGGGALAMAENPAVDSTPGLPWLSVKSNEGDVELIVFAADGAEAILEAATVFEEWSVLIHLIGKGPDQPVKVFIPQEYLGATRFWRVKQP